MTEKWKKRAKVPIYALKNLFLGHNTAIKVLFGRIICKFSDLSFDFGENWPFFGKSPISRLFLNSFYACARAQDISANIDPIDLKFSEVIL